MASIENQFEDQGAFEYDAKPATFGLGSFMKRAQIISFDQVQTGSVAVGEAIANLNTSAIFLEYMSAHVGEESLRDVISVVRNTERESGKPILVVLSLLKSGVALDSDEFREVCKVTYMVGLDAILVRVSGPEQVQYIRDECLGLRGRRVKVFSDGTKDMGVIQASDGVFVDDSFSASTCAEILRRQKLLFTSFVSMTDLGKPDVLVYPFDGALTPPTTEPSTPIGSMSRPLPKSFLFNELLKCVSSVPIKLVIAFSDDGASAAEISTQCRLRKQRIPPVLALTASESVSRYMGCLYGVIPLRMQSFVSVPTVISQALRYAKERGLVRVGESVAVVLNAPAVTASTNETCFEGVVQTRTVE